MSTGYIEVVPVNILWVAHLLSLASRVQQRCQKARSATLNWLVFEEGLR